MKKRLANIISNKGELPHLMIITDGDYVTKIPCSNTKLETLKRTAWEIYGIPKSRVIVSVILPEDDRPENNPPPIQIDIDRWS